MPTYTGTYIDIFFYYEKRIFISLWEGVKERKKRKMTREQRRGELFRISDHYGIKEDWGEFKGKLKGTFCAKPYPKSHNPSRFLFANACLLSRDTTWIFILSGRRKRFNSFGLKKMKDDVWVFMYGWATNKLMVVFSEFSLQIYKSISDEIKKREEIIQSEYKV